MIQFDLITLDQLFQALGPTMGYLKSVSYKLVFFFFCLAIFIEQFKSLTEDPKYLHVVLSLIVFFCIIMIYPTVMRQSYYFCSELSKKIMSDYEFSDFLNKIQGFMDAGNLSFWDITKGQITKIATFISFIFISLAINMLLIIRLILLGFIYCITPLVCTMIVFRNGLAVVRTVFITIVAICLWSVVANLFLKVLYVVVGAFYISGANILVIISTNVIVAVVLFSTPTITFQLVNFESIASTNLAQQAYSKMRDLSLGSALVAKPMVMAGYQGARKKIGNQIGKLHGSYRSIFNKDR